MSEKPGAQTPWNEINQMLATDERFEVHLPNWNGFLLAPKHSSQLAALLYLLTQKGLPFTVQGRGTISHPELCHTLIVSARAFSQLILHEDGVVEVGAGCPLSHLHQFLFERKQEIALEADLFSSSKRSVVGLLLSGQAAGIHYRQETIPETILGVEIVAWEGSKIKWGGWQKSAFVGPPLHKLLWGFHSFPGIIVKVILKTYSVPPNRLRLAWSFRQREELWEHLQSLKNFSSTWECLDCVLSGQLSDHSFIFAQISGLQDEMKSFSQLCPSYAAALQGGERLHLKNYLKQQKLKAYSSSLDQFLDLGEYLWYHELDKTAWWMTNRSLETKVDAQPLWKQRLSYSLSNRSEA
jgi:hypothetical protein